MARKWDKPVQNAILWEKMQKWKIMLDLRLFAVKSMKYSLTRFSKLQVYIERESKKLSPDGPIRLQNCYSPTMWTRCMFT